MLVEWGISVADFFDRFAWLVLVLAVVGALATVATGLVRGRMNWLTVICFLIAAPAVLGAIRSSAGGREDCAVAGGAGGGPGAPVPASCADASTLVPVVSVAVLVVAVAWGISTLATALMGPRAEAARARRDPVRR